MSGFDILLATLIGVQTVSAYSARERQADLSRDLARAEREAAEKDALRFRREQSARRAAARASRSASGIGFAGSPLLVDEASLFEALLGEQQIREGGRLRAMRLNQQAELQGQAGFLSILEGGTELLGLLEPSDFGEEDPYAFEDVRALD